MARLFADENFPRPAVEALRLLGHDVTTIQETRRGGQSLPDNEVLRSAAQDRRVLLTINRKHFLGLHRRQPEHSGIIICTYDPDFSGQTARIHTAIGEADQLDGRLIRVYHPHS